MLNDSIYNLLSGYKAIFVGESHGASEPAEFVEGIVKLFLAHNREVILGMEIPTDVMTEFSLKRTEQSLRETKFFSTENGDGRKSKAWAGLLLSLINTKVQYVFFLGTHDQWTHQNPGVDENWDSLMYENVNTAIKAHPNAVFVGLCGGFHNMLDTFMSLTPMAYYLRNASNRALKNNSDLLSLEHQFESGTEYNLIRSDSGDFELKVRPYRRSESPFSKAVKFDNYIFIGKGSYGYSGVIFSRKVTASLSWIEDKEK
ncbi:MAG: hypothetical protein JWO06_2261 [Bacteroidota bacterium]|nr:hypothetical protein [Bacteroidota bacterium]